MAYTKDFYHILGLEAPHWNNSIKAQSTADLRRGYKIALLAAHPDKQSSGTTDAVKKTTRGGDEGYTVDDVKEAYNILSDPKSRADYDNWLLHNRDTLRSSRSSLHTASLLPSSDFILGLELLDLSDFDVVETRSDISAKVDSARGDNMSEEEEQMQWTRRCRCGAETGFRILEEELEDAEGRGEKEVLVGCEGCSLWVRVGFEVEVG
ncbi:hypothetical protein CFE70_005754 [Pyrenophora teres f. teres 0-1]|uniref:Diphthamide biosynthesis protein 4 n=2 Tax=Pyrenophora teres f. teres TaxID=97479 RepID=E3S627_PYRTT|nr:hypothetical protein PTT_18147 [Pyrenophora teres f. teres 0-1]KAK1919672.1 hypothetical protein P3342_001965 [Pyrenophora teres f. teres]